MLCEECCAGSSSAFHLDVGSILSGFSGEQNRSSTALVVKVVLLCRGAAFRSCTRRSQVSDS